MGQSRGGGWRRAGKERANSSSYKNIIFLLQGMYVLWYTYTHEQTTSFYERGSRRVVRADPETVAGGQGIGGGDPQTVHTPGL